MRVNAEFGWCDGGIQRLPVLVSPNALERGGTSYAGGPSFLYTLLLLDTSPCAQFIVTLPKNLKIQRNSIREEISEHKQSNFVLIILSLTELPQKYGEFWFAVLLSRSNCARTSRVQLFTGCNVFYFNSKKINYN
jgi:hypothetical protein